MNSLNCDSTVLVVALDTLVGAFVVNESVEIDNVASFCHCESIVSALASMDDSFVLMSYSVI